MDSNVSKNTFSHKFFKLGFTNEDASISLKYLLKHQLLQSIDLYRQQINIELDLKFIDLVLEDKIILFQSYLEKLPSQNQNYKSFLTLPATSIGYSCSIAFILSSYFDSTASIIAKNLASLLTSNQGNIPYKSWFDLDLEIVSTGWLNFYLKAETIKTWLQLQTHLDSNGSTPDLASSPIKKTEDRLNRFPIQYIHARCCCLLLLGAREKLICLKDNTFGHHDWPIIRPQTISWFNSQQNLHFSATTEYELLFQLMMVSDSFLSSGVIFDWNKLAFNLSAAVAVFLADCPFLGKVRRENPQKAISRLGLIALSQYWLKRILLEKLRINAPIEL